MPAEARRTSSFEAGMTSRPVRAPRRGTEDAPRFDGLCPKELVRFIEDIEYWANECLWTPQQSIYYAKYYSSGKAEVRFEGLEELDEGRYDWFAAKKAMVGVFPSLVDGWRYTFGDLERLIEKWTASGIQSREELIEYQTAFIAISRYLEHQMVITETEAEFMFAKPIQGKLRKALGVRLTAKEKDLAPGESFTIETVAGHIAYLLAAEESKAFPAVTKSESSPTAAARTTPQEIQQVAQVISELQKQVQTLGKVTPMQTSPQECGFCGQEGHSIDWCRVASDNLMQGRCMRSQHDGTFSLPDGSQFFESEVYLTIADWVDDYWQQQYQVQEANQVDICAQNDQQAAFELAEIDEEIAALEAQLLEAQKKAQTKQEPSRIEAAESVFRTPAVQQHTGTVQRYAGTVQQGWLDEEFGQAFDFELGSRAPGPDFGRGGIRVEQVYFAEAEAAVSEEPTVAESTAHEVLVHADHVTEIAPEAEKQGSRSTSSVQKREIRLSRNGLRSGDVTSAFRSFGTQDTDDFNKTVTFSRFLNSPSVTFDYGIEDDPLFVHYLLESARKPRFKSFSFLFS